MKRILALLLSFLMVITLIPAACAEDIELVDVEDEELITLVEPDQTPGSDKLETSPKPTITVDPKSVTAYVGTTATFSVTAINADSYQWYWRKNADASWSKSTAASSTEATLSIEATTARSGFQYKCGVKNGNGTSYSAIVTLTVSEKPVITTQPKNKTASVGTTVKFTVKADGAASYQWYYRKTADSSWTKSTASGSTSATLSIEATAARSGFQYKCAVKNAKGTTYSKVVTLTVMSKPTITTQPLSYTAGVGATIYLKIKASGAESYQWQYRKSSSGTWTNTTLTGAKTATLTVPVTQARNGFQYRCKAINSAGTGYSKAATLTVSDLACGDKLTWALDSAGTLTVRGSGYLYDSVWDNYGPAVKKAVLGDYVTGVDSLVFMDVATLESISIGKKVDFIYLQYLPNLRNITVSEDNAVYSSLDGVLYNKDRTLLIRCPARKSGVLSIPGGVTRIEYNAFEDCGSLTELKIPSSVAEISWDSVTPLFQGCSALAAVTVASGNKSYASSGGVLFSKDKTTLLYYPCAKAGAYTIPDSVVLLDFCAFRGCTALTSVKVPAGVEDIYCSFPFCDSLTAITVDSRNKAFSSGDGVLFNKDKTALVRFPGGKSGSYTVPSSVTDITYSAFANCRSLSAVSIPASVKELGRFVFSDSPNLTAINVDSGNKLFSSKNGVLFNKDKTELLQYPGGKAGSYTIPSGVIFIGRYAFTGCAALTGVVIPDSVTEPNWSTFSGCTALTDVTFGKGLTYISENMFSGCTALKTVTIADNITTIKDCSFYGCSALTSVTIGKNVSDIYQGAFSCCSSLKDVYYRGTKTQWGKIHISEWDNAPLLNASIHYNAQ